MRKSQQQGSAEAGSKQLFGVDFHDFLQKEEAHTNMELAEEFGVSLSHVNKIKRKLK